MNRNFLVAYINHKQRIRQRAHVFNAAQTTLQLFLLARQSKPFFLGQAIETGILTHGLEFLKTLNGLLDRLEVGQHAA